MNRCLVQNRLINDIRKNHELYVLIIPTIMYFIVFKYWPMYGIQLAFRDFIPTRGFLGSPWVGFEHFERFFKSYSFWRLMKNTIGISLYELAVAFPAPIIFALMLNEVKHSFYKKTIQMVTYAPHFISVVVMSGMIITFLSPSIGMVNTIIKLFGFNSINFMAKPHLFKTIYVISNIWQNLGWNTIIYIAVLSSINVSMYEAARIDGATKLQCIFYINIPALAPTIIILLIRNAGQIMNVGWQKILLLQNDMNMSAADVIQTYVYRVGIIQSEYSYTTAIGLFSAIVNLILLVIVNLMAKKLGETSLW